MLWVPEYLAMSEGPTKRLARRAAPLTFGIFGSIQRSDGLQMEPGGSGIFVLPYMALTARHVDRELMRLDSRHERPPRRAFETQHAATLFQVRNPMEDEREHSLWHVTRTWDSWVTDVTLVQYAAGQAPTHEPFGYFDWQLLAPPVGSRVTIMGFSKIDLRQDLDDFEIHMDFAVEHATVTRVFRLHRERGMLDFPCFELDKRLDHGLSGGPVFSEDRLAGLVTSSTNFDERGYCATLWPVALMEYDSELGITTSFGDLLTRGIIRAVDWHAVKSHISLRRDEMDRRYAYIDQIPGAGDDIEP